MNKPSFFRKSTTAWGPGMPDWVRALAEACDESGLRKTAKKLRVSPAIVSLAINARRVPEKLAFIKARTKNILMVTMVVCPVLGVMGKEECLQEQARPFSGANPLRVQLYRACRDGCPNYKEKRDGRGKNPERGIGAGRPGRASNRGTVAAH